LESDPLVEMQIILLLARLVLCATFAVAGVAKLADPANARKALGDFGVPGPLAGPVAVLLPLVEIATAFVLVPVPSAWFGAVAAFALLTLFSLAIALNLVQGRRPECNCFGQIASKPIGWWTLARNVALMATAGLVVWRGSVDPGASTVRWIGALTTAERVGVFGGALGLGLLAAMVALTLQLLRQQGRLLLRFDAIESRLNVGSPSVAENWAQSQVGLPIGTLAPAFALKTLNGESIALNRLTAEGKPTLLLFTNPNCGPCEALLPEIAQWQGQLAAALTIAIVTEGAAKDVRAKIAAGGLDFVLLQRQREVADAYQAWGTPAALLVAADGSIASFVAQGADAIRSLVAQAAGGVPVARANGHGANGQGFNTAPTVTIGEKPPSLRLPDHNGTPRAVSSLHGRPTLLLFWNPGCGFCQQMLNDLRARDADAPNDAPALLVISSGTAEEARAMDLRAPVLLDRDLRAATTFGAGGTPMAILLDAKGRIASGVVGGAEAVLALANGLGSPESVLGAPILST
jgi:thiol-disulfide isomerase/thioredoxin